MTWVLLLITVDGSIVAGIPFRDPMDCGNALPVIHNAIRNEWPDAMAQCQRTDKAIVRPRMRGEG